MVVMLAVMRSRPARCSCGSMLGDRAVTRKLMLLR
jgi:hypothetical protein